MWVIEATDEYGRRLKWYAKKHPRELAAVLDNLDTYFKCLEGGTPPLQVRFGFLHHEPMGVVAIDQKGGGKNLAQTRLYVFPDPAAEKLYAITLGDKQSQKADLATCREFVRDLRQGQPEREHGDNPTP